MSKEYLEAIERIKNKFINFFHEDNPDVECVEDALQRLETIDNANPSEALKCLEEIENYCEWSEFNSCLSHDFPKEYITIKQALIKAQEQDFNYKNIVIPFFDELVKLLGTNDTDEMLDKIKAQEKVLSIIKEKNVDIKFLRTLINSDSEYTRKNALKIYNLCLDSVDLTQEEFDLLKRWVG